MEMYYYISGKMGMKSNGSFTKNKSQWIVFYQNEVDKIGDKKPYSATKKGVFVKCKKIS